MKTAASVRTAVVALSLLAAACANDAPTIEASSAGKASAAGAGVSLALSPEEVARSGPATPFSPFGDPTLASVGGGREVINNPTKTEVLAAASNLPEMSLGSPDAPVTLVQYASLTCPYCKRFDAEVFPVLKREYIDTGKVRYILRDFPIGRTSGQASVALRCAAPGKYFELYSRFLATQPAWVSQEVRLDPIADIAANGGVTRAAFDACRADAALVEALKAEKDRGRKLGIIGTPNFFVEDKLVKKALTVEELRAHLDTALATRTASAAAPAPAENP